MTQIRKRGRESSDWELESKPSHHSRADDASSPKIPRTSQNGHDTQSNSLNTLTIPNLMESTSATKQPLAALYAESVVAKIWGVAQKALGKCSPPTLYPEYTKPGGLSYVYRDSDFWTSGFFPGCLYLLLERQMKYPHSFPPSPDSGLPQFPHPLQLQHACEWWTANLHQNAHVTTTHDLSFMIQPWARRSWELRHDSKSYETLITAAETLALRYNYRTQCLRSWDTCVTNRYSFVDPKLDFLVIIDNMLNLDLLFWAATELRNTKLRNIAIAHATTTQRDHIREDYSTFHVVNFDPATGAVKAKITNQGYSDSSCWSRGQAWAITGFAQTYLWTRDDSFLKTACGCADYFLAHLPSNGIPPWDFLAPATPESPTDTSAAMIACYGMLLLHEALIATDQPSPYFKGALHILTSVCSEKLSPTAHFTTSVIDIPSVEHGSSTQLGLLGVEMGKGSETILEGATINNYEFAPRRWANHGLVYADYYFLLVGNKLLDMGIGQRITSQAMSDK